MGGLSLSAALFLGVLGVLGVVSLLIAAATGSEFWSDERDEQLVSAVLFALIIEQARPLARGNVIHASLRRWVARPPCGSAMAAGRW